MSDEVKSAREIMEVDYEVLLEVGELKALEVIQKNLRLPSPSSPSGYGLGCKGQLLKNRLLKRRILFAKILRYNYDERIKRINRLRSEIIYLSGDQANLRPMMAAAEARIKELETAPRSDSSYSPRDLSSYLLREEITDDEKSEEKNKVDEDYEIPCTLEEDLSWTGFLSVDENENEK